MTRKEFEASLQYKSDEEIQELIDGFAAKYDLEEERSFSKEELDELFNYHFCLQAVGDLPSAAEVFHYIKPRIDEFYEQNVSIEDALELLAEWTFIAMGHTEERPDEFVCMPYYEEVISAYAMASDKFRVREQKVKLQLAHHYRFWIQEVGNPDHLPEGQRNILDTAIETYPGLTEKQAEKLESEGELKDAKELYYSLFKFYNAGSSPNEAISNLKRAIHILPKTAEYTPADSGDMLMELGKIFFRYKKYEVAEKYFRQALEMYREEGEELEMFAMQAEGWIDECKRMV